MNNAQIKRILLTRCSERCKSLFLFEQINAYTCILMSLKGAFVKIFSLFKRIIVLEKTAGLRRNHNTSYLLHTAISGILATVQPWTPSTPAYIQFNSSRFYLCNVCLQQSCLRALLTLMYRTENTTTCPAVPDTLGRTSCVAVPCHTQTLFDLFRPNYSYNYSYYSYS